VDEAVAIYMRTEAIEHDTRKIPHDSDMNRVVTGSRSEWNEVQGDAL